MNSSSLSVGDVVSAGLRIYRDRFKDYFPIAITAALWSIVPVYGWAKYTTAAGLISRLAFGEITEKPESVTEARNQVNPLMWTFLLGSLLVVLIFLGVMLGAGVIIILLAFIASSAPALNFILIPGFILGFFILFLWLFTRLSLVELIIGIERTSEAKRALDRSWSLTKPFVSRLLLINFVASLITIPIYFISNLITGVIQVIVGGVFGEESAVASQIIFVFSLVINVLFTGITMPFWQSIKAAIYYDLRSQREGIDLL
jgi:hypothetical protein